MRTPSCSEIAVAEAGAAAAAVVLSNPSSDVLASSSTTTSPSPICYPDLSTGSSSALRLHSSGSTRTPPQSTPIASTSGQFVRRQVQHHLHHHHHVHHVAPSVSPSPSSHITTGMSRRLRVGRPPSGPSPHSVSQSPPLAIAPRSESAAPCAASRAAVTTPNVTMPCQHTTATSTTKTAPNIDHRSSFQQSMNTLRKVSSFQLFFCKLMTADNDFSKIKIVSC